MVKKKRTSANCIYAEQWKNGATIQVLFYEQAQHDEDKSDRIHLMITDCDGKNTGWLMNAEDAIGVVRGLSAAIARALELGVPLGPSG